MSTIPELPEAGRSHLRRAIRDLPSHEPDPAAWAHIEAQLAADEALARAVPALPQHEPDDALWHQIAARLDQATPAAPVRAVAAVPDEAVVRPLWPAMRRAMAVAASVVLLLGAWWLLRPATIGPRETVTYSQEEVAPLPVPAAAPTPDPLEQEGLSFIDAHCTSLPTVCQKGEFRNLRAQLTELEAQEKQLRQDARRFGQSPELLRQQAQLTTLKANITRELVQLLIS